MSKASKKPKPIDGLDSPELTAREFAKMRPVRERMPAFVAAAKRGRPKIDNPKGEVVSIRVPKGTLARLKASGSDWRKRAERAIERIAKKA